MYFREAGGNAGVVGVSALIEVRGLTKKFKDRKAGRVEAFRRYGRAAGDHTSFIVMRRLKLTDVLGNDQHFRAAGFHTLF